MTTQLTAVFDDRDGADLALMRLRRNGIDYSVAELKKPDKAREDGAFGLSDVTDSYGLPSVGAVSASEMYNAVLGSRAVMQRSAASKGQARLTLNVNSDQVLRARAIICSVKGRIL